jgi:hypothetical protein
MARQFLVIAALFGVLAVACGKYGPPVRTHSETAAAGSSATQGKSGASSAEDSDEEEKRP